MTLMFSTKVWFAITSLGSAGLLLPAAALIAGQLVAAGAWRSALWWSASFVAAVGVVLASKIAFLGWGFGIRSLDFTGISGHTTLAAAVLPVLGFLLLFRKPGRLPMLGALGGFALGLAVGVSRWIVGAHSPAEVVVGFGLGALVAAGFMLVAGRREKPFLHAWAMAVVLTLVALFHYNYVTQGTTHDLVVKIALYASGRDQPFSRAEWLRSGY
jgi:membrane-associated phospholipid phosphatase